MTSHYIKVAFIILAVFALQVESQTARLPVPQRSQGLSGEPRLPSRLEELVHSTLKRCGKSCQDQRGSSFRNYFAKLEKFPDYSRTASEETAINVTRDDTFLQRDLLLKRRKGKRISKRKLKKQLQQCEASLQETQVALEAPRLLFVQMAQHCTLEMTAGRYYLRTTDMDPDTYVFAEMPSQYATVWPTSYFVGYLFDEFFPIEKPNAAFTFNVYRNESEKSFEGPLISVVLSSHHMSLQEDNSSLVVYELGQSSDQAETSPLSNFFRGVDPIQNASVTFEHCSMFIDPAVDDRNMMSTESYVAALESVDQVLDDLEKSANAIEQGLAGVQVSSANQSMLETFSRVWQVKNSEKRIQGDPDSSASLKSAADTLRATANLIRQCKDSSNGCDNRDLAASVSNILLTTAPVIGAAFSPVGVGVSLISSIGHLLSILAYDLQMQSNKGLLPSLIQEFVIMKFKTFDLIFDTDLRRLFTDFWLMDLDNVIRHSGSIGYIIKRMGPDCQASVDKEVRLSDANRDLEYKLRICVLILFILSGMNFRAPK
jgi:hypothetical protein